MAGTEDAAVTGMRTSSRSTVAGTRQLYCRRRHHQMYGLKLTLNRLDRHIQAARGCF